jgi:DNA polymerase-4
MNKNHKKIIHIDMDAFFASVEQRDNPELRGKPVVVGGDPHERGVVASCSYEARSFGIHSAMPGKRAFRCCPHAIFVRPRFDKYCAVSDQIREIFYEYSDLVEPLSLDEAFIDVTDNKKNIPYATEVAMQIKDDILKKTGLTASAGVSFNKFLSKVASDINKPNGIKVVKPCDADEFIDNLPIRKFFGVGKVTEQKMSRIGIRTGADLKKYDRIKLIQIFGKAGNYFYDIAHSQDNRPVIAQRERKSLGKETTLHEDINNIEQMRKILEGIALQIESLLIQKEVTGKTLTLKVKYSDFQSITRSITLSQPIKESALMMSHACSLLNKTEAGKKKVRLLGLTISNLESHLGKYHKYRQLLLPFDNRYF